MPPPGQLAGKGKAAGTWPGRVPSRLLPLHSSSRASGTLTFLFPFLIFTLFSASPDCVITAFPIFLLTLLLYFHLFFSLCSLSPFHLCSFLSFFFLSCLFTFFLLFSFIFSSSFLFLLVASGRGFSNSQSFSAFSTRIFLLFSFFKTFLPGLTHFCILQNAYCLWCKLPPLHPTPPPTLSVLGPFTNSLVPFSCVRTGTIKHYVRFCGMCEIAS